MTRDEILAMEAGRRWMRWWLRRSMGRTDFTHPGFFWKWAVPRWRRMGWILIAHVASASEGDTGLCVKHYSTNITIAWQVIERVLALLSRPGPMGGERTGRCSINLTQTRSMDFNSSYYQVYFGRQGGNDKIAVLVWATLSLSPSAAPRFLP